MKSKKDPLLELVIKTAEDKKAVNTTVLTLRPPHAGMFDHLVLMSGESNPQLRAIARELELRVKRSGIKGINYEGEVESGWLVLDLGTIIVHVMTPRMREYYDIEGLWGKEAIVYHV
ncbi:ribosome silencing factor [Candidatus Saganbacteria bacterium]|nr:ribosome silencing factor [Candidatus Saganbacteria bacterium]